MSEPGDRVTRAVSEWAGGDFVTTDGRGAAVPPVHLCAACARAGHCRLGLGVERLQPDGRVETDLVCGAENEGGPGVAHGGWTAGVCDELVGHVPLLHGQLAVTGTLTVRFVRPVPIDRPLRGQAWVTRKEGSRWFVEARLCLLATGAELARAEAVMVQRDLGHFDRHRQWLADQDTAS